MAERGSSKLRSAYVTGRGLLPGILRLALDLDPLRLQLREIAGDVHAAADADEHGEQRDGVFVHGNRPGTVQKRLREIEYIHFRPPNLSTANITAVAAGEGVAAWRLAETTKGVTFRWLLPRLRLPGSDNQCPVRSR